MKGLTFGFLFKGQYLLLGLLIILSNSVLAQDVNNYPKDGKIKNLKGRVQEDIVVAKDGTGDFLYLADAIEAIRVFLPEPITVYIKEGVYREKLEIPATVTNVTFKGEGPEKTKIVYDDFSGKGKIGTFESYTLKVSGNTLTFKDLTIENSAGSVGQAVALHADGDRLVFENCNFKGNQDTMFASGENQRQYYKNCYIEGTTDFIFGSGTALFENCEIHSKSNSYITAASTPKWVKQGYVFKDCKLTAAEGVDKVYLGRPWRAHAKTVFINCEMGSHIAEERWHNWGNPENEKTVFYAEGGSIGPGADASNSVDWAVQLDKQENNQYSIDKIFEGLTDQLDTKGEEWYGIVME
ncbi:pectinesterase family protein [Echinicola jeungdonensis]|uniref:Pectinesterase n=1 Tax=Echinicola jeungdonensis TaxID=709343 RepID=A0ABV5J3B2_9BACT|nr:pectinesterase family protein [Echinicola jeungdonensis]MDN3668921.1 pectinesterase family protein [Echinicola jeungdonensis]